MTQQVPPHVTWSAAVSSPTQTFPSFLPHRGCQPTESLPSLSQCGEARSGSELLLGTGQEQPTMAKSWAVGDGQTCVLTHEGKPNGRTVRVTVFLLPQSVADKHGCPKGGCMLCRHPAPHIPTADLNSKHPSPLGHHWLPVV